MRCKETEDTCLQMKRGFRFFHFLDENDIRELEPYFSCRYLKTGEDLWQEGEKGDFAAFIVSGKIQSSKATEFPGRQVVVGVYGHESLIGIIGLLFGESRPVTATAIEDSRVLLLNRDDFDEINRRNPELGGRLMKGMLFSLTMRLRQSYERLAAIF